MAPKAHRACPVNLRIFCESSILPSFQPYFDRKFLAKSMTPDDYLFFLNAAGSHMNFTCVTTACSTSAKKKINKKLQLSPHLAVIGVKLSPHMLRAVLYLPTTYIWHLPVLFQCPSIFCGNLTCRETTRIYFRKKVIYLVLLRIQTPHSQKLVSAHTNKNIYL